MDSLNAFPDDCPVEARLCRLLCLIQNPSLFGIYNGCARLRSSSPEAGPIRVAPLLTVGKPLRVALIAGAQKGLYGCRVVIIPVLRTWVHFSPTLPSLLQQSRNPADKAARYLSAVVTQRGGGGGGTSHIVDVL